MKAVVHHRYGPPDVLELRDIEKPATPVHGVRVRVRAAALNRLDWYSLTGTPYLGRLAGPLGPGRRVPGVDFAGTIETVGSGVQRLRPGDEVFGAGYGALAEYVCVAESRAALKPANVTFEQAAAVPVAGLTAFQGLRDPGRVRAGHKVLINGASGGVGTFAVQIAKAFGAEVTAVCSTRNVDRVRSIGADRVIDYQKEDFTRREERYDLLFDVAGSRAWSEGRRVLEPDATWVIAGGPKTNRWIGPLGHIVGVLLASRGASQKVVFLVAKVRDQDLTELGALLEAGRVKPVIDRCYPLSEVAEAFRVLGEGHPQGKLVITL